MEYTQYLEDKGLLPNTIGKYTKFEEMFKQTSGENYQEKVYNFMREHKYPLSHAFLKDYLINYKKIKEDLNIPKGVDKNKTPRRKNQITQEKLIEILELWSSRNEQRDKLLLKTLWITGCRCNELVNISVNDIDFEKATIYIEKGKGNKRRSVSVNEGFLQELKGFIQLNKLDDKLFNLTTRRVQQIIKAMGKRAKVFDLWPHLIRSSVATHLISKNTNPFWVQRFLGHSSIRTTQTYVGMVEEEKVLEKVSELTKL